MGIRVINRSGPFSIPTALRTELNQIPPGAAPASVPPGNPDPRRFFIVKIESVGRWVVAMIDYPDCTNFEGMKILVWRGVSRYDIENALWIDPHFTEGHLSPFARFKPTDAGWAAALQMCHAIE